MWVQRERESTSTMPFPRHPLEKGVYCEPCMFFGLMKRLSSVYPFPAVFSIRTNIVSSPLVSTLTAPPLCLFESSALLIPVTWFGSSIWWVMCTTSSLVILRRPIFVNKQQTQPWTVNTIRRTLKGSCWTESGVELWSTCCNGKYRWWHWNKH